MNIDKKNSIVIYEAKDGGVELRADIEKDTIWATQAQIAKLFETTPQNITIHLKSIYKDRELNKKSTCKQFLQVQNEGKRSVKRYIEFYNLDTIISIGYRVNSKKATLFRIWATGVLREYLKNGYVLQEFKLKKSPEVIEGLQESLDLISSNKYKGKVKGRLTLKISKDLEKNESIR